MIGLSVSMFITLLLIFLRRQAKSNAVDHRYSSEDTVPIYANKAYSYFHPGETYGYYDLPFCSQDAKVHVDKMLDGNRLVLSPYKIEYLMDKETELLCTKTLSKTDVSQFQRVIKKGYRMLFYHEDMPFWALFGTLDMNHGDEIYYLYNHYDFEFVYHNGTVIGIVVLVDSSYMVVITDDMEADVEFTYSVRWFAKQDSYDERTTKYTSYSNGPDQHNSVFGYSTANSSFTILIMIICVLIFYTRVIRKDISKYACDVEEAEMADNKYETGWKNIRGNVFRFPKHKSLFAATLGSGTQLLVLTIAILVLGANDVFQRHLPGVFVNALAVVYALTSVVSGYTSTSFYHQLQGTKWIKSILLTAGLFFGPLFVTFVVNNTVAFSYGSTTSLPMSEIIKFTLLWIFLALPLLILGAIIGKNSVSDFQAPCRTAKCPKEVPQLRWYKGVLPQMVLAGFFPFSVIIIQIYDMLNAVFGYSTCTSYDSMLITLFLLLITTALVSVMMTYFQLADEDHEWWWRCVMYNYIICVFCSLLPGLKVFGFKRFSFLTHVVFLWWVYWIVRVRLFYLLFSISIRNEQFCANNHLPWLHGMPRVWNLSCTWSSGFLCLVAICSLPICFHQMRLAGILTLKIGLEFHFNGVIIKKSELK
ncbi:hypothetical protein QVD17_29112 [Tagetes erecta]|uniref:Transmembrane 9 superfamily member n=1 Tax=Tagetes erecta TaxID=13708 RepID=A0AAD8KEB8_TARER|nr:hypothetical protein QVD17_29112 [Tagetes erecta]